MRGYTSQLLISFNAEDVRPTYHTINVIGSVCQTHDLGRHITTETSRHASLHRLSLELCFANWSIP